MIKSVCAVTGPISAGRVRLIAVGAPQRSAGLPDTPTIRESGLPEFEATSWIGLYGPANLPQPIVARLSKEIVGILSQPDVGERMRQMGMDTKSGTPQELADVLDRDLKRWGKLVRDANIRTE
jgi:tripartite-type tricarboxylate transporter receptor subunit TctC